MILFLIDGVLAINYSMRSQSNLVDLQNFEGSDEGFREAADYTMSLIAPYLIYLVIGFILIYGFLHMLPTR